MIGLIVIIMQAALKMTQKGLLMALSGCSAVARGLTMPGTAVLLAATGTTLTTGTSVLVSGSSSPG